MACSAFILLGACQQNKKTHQDAPEPTIGNTRAEDTLNSAEPIVIMGHTDDPMAFEYLNFLNYSYFPGTNRTGPSEEKINDTLKLMFESIEQPQIIEIFAFGDSHNFYNTRILVTPGDSVSMSFKNKNIAFEGENAAHYNFYFQLDPTSTEWGLNKYEGNIKEYKKRSKAIYQRRQEFFKDYIAQNKVSNDFKMLVGAELKFEYLFNLIAPRTIETSIGVNANNPDFLKTIAQNYNVEKYGFFDIGNYLGHMTIEDFKRPELINNDYFKRSLVSFIRYYFVSPEYMSYTLQNFEAEEEYIQKNLKGKLEDYALTRLLYDYYKKGLGQGKKDNEYIKSYIGEHKAKITNPSYLEIFNEIKQELDLKGFGFSAAALAEKLVTLDGDTITMGEVLKKTENKLKVFGFWASWCSPCISEIKETPEFRKNMEAEYHVEWVLVSVDTDQERWLKTSKKLEADLNTEYQYRIPNLKNSQIIRSLKGGTQELFSIPRYVIVGLEGQIEVYSAPKPSDTLLFKRVIEKIK